MATFRITASVALIFVTACVYDWDSVLSLDVGTDLRRGDARADLIRPDSRPHRDLPGCTHPKVTQDCQNGWCTIPAGCFLMGSPKDEPCREVVDNYRYKDKKLPEPQHQVTLTGGLVIQRDEVRQKAFETLMGYNPTTIFDVKCPADAANPGCDDCPAVCVTWHEAVAYCNALSKPAEQCYDCTGAQHSTTCKLKDRYLQSQTIYDCDGYRLPTEAEWEYAYRAGSHSPLFPSAANDGSITHCNAQDPNADKIGWYGFNSTGETHKVGLKAPNAWGLFDMAGNAWELCHDWYYFDGFTNPQTDPVGWPFGQFRVIRGGSLWEGAERMRGAHRNYISPTHLHFSMGFRCVRSLTK